jgi:hypothetical protein
MLSFGCAAYKPDKTLVSTFSANLELLPEATPDESTMAWWQQHQEAYEACRQDLQQPSNAMHSFAKWVRKTHGSSKPVVVCYPAGYDFTFLYWYLMKFTGKSPFSFSALDVKTYAMAMLKKEYRQCSKRAFPKRWFDKLPHTHVALDDAIEQGAMFINMLQENTGATG